MTLRAECPQERAAIERARRYYGPYIQAEAARQRILGDQSTAAKLSSRQLTWLAEFRLQIDLDGRGSVHDLVLVMNGHPAVCTCDDRRQAVRQACTVVQAELTRAGIMTQTDFRGSLAGLRRSMAAIEADHARHVALQSRRDDEPPLPRRPRTGDALKADAAKLHRAARERAEQENQRRETDQ